MKWFIERVNNRLTLEACGVSVEVEKALFQRLSEKLPYNEEESREYKEIDDELRERIEETIKIEGSKSRNICCGWASSPGSHSKCISFIQLLRREISILNVYMRSSDILRFSNDLAFLCRLALKNQVDLLQIHIGSSHLYLE